MSWTTWWAAHGEAIVTLILGFVLGALINWFFYRKAERPKRINTEVLSRNRIIHANESERRNLKVVYGTEEVENPNITVVRVGNTGKEAILEREFSPPISIDFGKARLIAFDVIDRSDPDVNGKLTDPTETRVDFVPELFNAGEWVDLQFVTDGDPVRPVIRGRFAGQTHPVEDIHADTSQVPTWLRTVGTFLLWGLIPVVIFISSGAGGLTQPTWGTLLASIAIALMFASIFRDLMSRRNLRKRWKKSKRAVEAK